MQSLSPEARARLAAFTRQQSPDAEDEARVLAALERRLAAPAPRRRVGVVVLTALALAAGLVLAVSWATAPARRGDDTGVQAPHAGAPQGQELARPVPTDMPSPADTSAPPGRADGSAVPSDTSAPPGRADGSAVPADPSARSGPVDGSAVPSHTSARPGSAVPSDTSASPESADGSAVPGDRRPVSSDTRHVSSDTSTAPRRPRGRDAGDDIAAEVALLREAKLAAPARRLELLREHARRFPGGTFAAERRLLEAETRCALGEVDAARELVARFTAEFPSSPLAPRVAKICSEEP